MRPRSWAVTSRQPSSKARRAARAALSTSAASASGTRAITSPVAGFITAKVRPDSAGTHAPSTNIW